MLKVLSKIKLRVELRNFANLFGINIIKERRLISLRRGLENNKIRSIYNKDKISRPITTLLYFHQGWLSYLHQLQFKRFWICRINKGTKTHFSAWSACTVRYNAQSLCNAITIEYDPDTSFIRTLPINANCSKYRGSILWMQSSIVLKNILITLDGLSSLQKLSSRIFFLPLPQMLTSNHESCLLPIVGISITKLDNVTKNTIP